MYLVHTVAFKKDGLDMYSIFHNCIYKTVLRSKQNDHTIIIMIGGLDSMISKGQPLKFWDCDNKIERHKKTAKREVLQYKKMYNPDGIIFSFVRGKKQETVA